MADEAQLGQLQQAPRANFGGLAGDVGNQGAAFIQNMLEQRRLQEQQAFQQAQLALQAQTQKSGVVERGLDRDVRQQQFGELRKAEEVGRAEEREEGVLDRAAAQRRTETQISGSPAVTRAVERDQRSAIQEAIHAAVGQGMTRPAIMAEFGARGSGLSESEIGDMADIAAVTEQRRLEALRLQNPAIAQDEFSFERFNDVRRSAAPELQTKEATVTAETLTPEEREVAADAFERFKAAGKSAALRVLATDLADFSKPSSCFTHKTSSLKVCCCRAVPTKRAGSPTSS